MIYIQIYSHIIQELSRPTCIRHLGGGAPVWDWLHPFYMTVFIRIWKSKSWSQISLTLTRSIHMGPVPISEPHWYVLWHGILIGDSPWPVLLSKFHCSQAKVCQCSCYESASISFSTTLFSFPQHLSYTKPGGEAVSPLFMLWTLKREKKKTISFEQKDSWWCKPTGGTRPQNEMNQSLVCFFSSFLSRKSPQQP